MGAGGLLLRTRGYPPSCAHLPINSTSLRSTAHRLYRDLGAVTHEHFLNPVEQRLLRHLGERLREPRYLGGRGARLPAQGIQLCLLRAPPALHPLVLLPTELTDGAELVAASLVLHHLGQRALLKVGATKT